MGRAGAETHSSSTSSNQFASQCHSSRECVSEIPDGLIGESCNGVAWLDGVQCQCLMDTGSQVSILTQSFYSAHLSHRELLSFDNLLHIEGAAGQRVPYLGYIEVEVQFPQNACGTGRQFSTLMLVSPDQPYNSKVPY